MAEIWELCKVTRSSIVFSRQGKPDLEMNARDYIRSKGGPDKKKAIPAEAIPYLLKDGWTIAGVGPLGCTKFKRLIIEEAA